MKQFDTHRLLLNWYKMTLKIKLRRFGIQHILRYLGIDNQNLPQFLWRSHSALMKTETGGHPHVLKLDFIINILFCFWGWRILSWVNSITFNFTLINYSYFRWLEGLLFVTRLIYYCRGRSVWMIHLLENLYLNFSR